MDTPRILGFDSSLRPRKTEAARALLHGAPFSGTRAQRAWLIAVDGRKSLRDLAALARALGLVDADLQELLDQGWIEWARSSRLSPPAVGLVATPARAVSSPPPSPPPGPSRSWAAAKMYAIDLVRVLLPAHQQQLVDLARTATTAEELQGWLEAVAAELTARAGPERAELFLGKVRQVLPDAPQARGPLEPR